MLDFKDFLPYFVDVRSIAAVAFADMVEHLEHRLVAAGRKVCKLEVHRFVPEQLVLEPTGDLVRTKYFRRARRQERRSICERNEPSRVAVDGGRRPSGIR